MVYWSRSKILCGIFVVGLEVVVGVTVIEVVISDVATIDFCETRVWVDPLDYESVNGRRLSEFIAPLELLGVGASAPTVTKPHISTRWNGDGLKRPPGRPGDRSQRANLRGREGEGEAGEREGERERERGVMMAAVVVEVAVEGLWLERRNPGLGVAHAL